MFDDISGKEAKKTLNFLLNAAIDIEMSSTESIFIEKVLSYARKIFHASAGSIALIEDNQLKFITLQNDEVDIQHIIGKNKCIPLDTNSFAGYVAITGETLYIPDPYHIDAHAPYKFNDHIDQETGFKTKSLLAMPLRHPSEGIIGTFEILNPKDQCFHELNIGIAHNFSVIAAVSFVNMRLRTSLQHSYLDTLERLGHVAEYKDEDTYQHIQRIRFSSQVIAEQMQTSQEFQENIFHASAMHDIGKVGIPDYILNKPGKLDADEWRIMQTHAANGGSILKGSQSAILQMSERIAMSHHEKWNGQGYPNGLKGDEIPLEAQIVAVADVFDALTQKRVYKKAWPLNEALNLIQHERGQHFAPEVVDAFFACKDKIIQIHRKHGSIIET